LCVGRRQSSTVGRRVRHLLQPLQATPSGVPSGSGVMSGALPGGRSGTDCVSCHGGTSRCRRRTGCFSAGWEDLVRQLANLRIMRALVGLPTAWMVLLVLIGLDMVRIPSEKSVPGEQTVARLFTLTAHRVDARWAVVLRMWFGVESRRSCGDLSFLDDGLDDEDADVFWQSVGWACHPRSDGEGWPAYRPLFVSPEA